jgi:tetratricopeptide (TPR) repeat protein
MAPTANLFLLIGTIMAERFLYLPSVAFAGLLAWTGWSAYRWLHPRWPAARVAAPAALVLLCLAFAGRTFARNFDWFDERSLWTSALGTSPASYKTHDHLASVWASPPSNNLDAADRHADQSLAILQALPYEQRVSQAYSTAGACYRLTGDTKGPSGGAEWYRKSLDTLLVGEKVDLALEREMALQNRLAGKTVGPAHWVPLYLELSRTYLVLGQFQNALDALAVGRWSDPQAEVFEQKSKIYQAMGDAPRAVVSLLEGITMGSTEQVRLAAEVVDLYRKSAPESCALAGSGTSAAIDFNCPLVRNDVCLAGRNVAIEYRQMHRESDAMATAASAIRSLGCSAELFR